MRKALFPIGALLFGIATFMLASSYLIEREQPKWLALAVGALAFPVLPVVWQIVGERRRRKRIATAKMPPKDSLAASDRYILRAIAVAIVVIAPQVVIGKLDVVRAAWNHRTWWWPEPETAYEEGHGSASKQALVRHVPADAEAILTVHGLDDGKSDALLAYGDHQLLGIGPDDGKPIGDKVDELNKKRNEIPWKIDAVDKVDGPDGLMVVASERWRGLAGKPGAGPSAALAAELDRAPDAASAVFAFVPTKSPEKATIKAIAAWVVVDADKKRFTADARVEAVDAKSADQMLDELRGIWREKNKDVPAKCRAEVDALADDMKIERAGLVLTFHLDLKSEKIGSLMFCGMKSD